MSQGERIPLAKAVDNANALVRLIGPKCYATWTVAGSIRRCCPEVGDIEHVVIPNFGEAMVPGEFFPTAHANLLHVRLDELAEAGQIKKGHAWGEKMRAFIFDGVKHDLFLADAKNYGPILAIRTGPADFSRDLVTIIKEGGRVRQADGYVRYQNGDILACPNERDYFALAGIGWIEPQDRKPESLRVRASRC